MRETAPPEIGRNLWTYKQVGMYKKRKGEKSKQYVSTKEEMEEYVKLVQVFYTSCISHLLKCLKSCNVKNNCMEKKSMKSI